MVTKEARIKSVFATMSAFPVLMGRVTERQAEYIIENIDKLEGDPFVKIGSYYKNSQGDLIKIVGTLDSVTNETYRTQLFDEGYRYQDEYRRNYRPDGTHGKKDTPSSMDLVEKVNPSSHSKTDEQAGLMARRRATSKLDIKVGHCYLTASNTVIKIIEKMAPDHPSYSTGRHFITEDGVYYMAGGYYSEHSATGIDLIAEVDNAVDRRITINHDGIVAELGYVAAMGMIIRAVKLYRSVYGVGLAEAKKIVQAAGEAAKKNYQIPQLGRIPQLESELEQLREQLRVTRRLVAACCDSGFTDELPVRELFLNQGAITRLVPLRPQDHAERIAMAELMEDINKVN